MGEMDDIRNIVILTGAGISAESGIGAYRDAGGPIAIPDFAHAVGGR